MRSSIPDTLALIRCHFDSDAGYSATRDSAATSGWGVNWSEEAIARDLVQNFFDANRTRLDEVRIEELSAGVVRVSGPSPCNLEQLYYFGSEKGPDEVGQYGEGFKVAVTCLLRNHRVTPLIASQRKALAIRLADDLVPDTTTLYPLLYDFFDLPTPCPGTQLILPQCSRRLIEALKAGLTHFYFPGNPLLGALLWSHRDGAQHLYASATCGGHLFYRNLKRGRCADIPLVLVLNRETPSIEKLIAHDRDRNAFDGKVADAFYKQFTKQSRMEAGAARIILDESRGSWEGGHALLSALASECWFKLDDLFEAEHFAHSTPENGNRAEALRYAELEQRWAVEGKRRLPGYFCHFGAVTARWYLAEQDKRALQEAKLMQSRRPTAAERTALDVMANVLQEVSPEISGILARRSVEYTVAKTEVLQGQLKEANRYSEFKVFLAESQFEADFAEALATYLHEHAHIFGHDGSRGFTDALTRVIEEVVRFRSSLDDFERRWLAAQETIVRERNQQDADRKQDDPPWRDEIAEMNADSLRKLIERLPPAQLKRLLQSAPSDSGIE